MNHMENPYNANIFSERIAVALTLYLCFSYILRSLGMRNRMGWIFLAVYWLYAVIRYRGRFYISRRRLTYVWIGFVVLLFFLLPIANNSAKKTQSLIVDILFCVLYLLSAKIDNRNFDTVIKIFIRVGLFMALFITICSLFPRVYSSYIVPLLAKTEMEDVISSYEKGYGVTIGGSAIYPSFIICVGVFFCFADLLYGSKYRKRIVNTIYLAIFFLGLFITGRRGTPIALALSMVLVYLITTPKNAKKILKRTGLLIAIVVIFIVLINILVRNGYLTRYVSSAQLLIGNNIDINVINRLTSSRLFLSIEAWKLFLSSPIIGVGWGTFALHVSTKVFNVHNCWLQFLCETGIIGFTCLSVPIVGLFLNSRKKLKRVIKNTHAISTQKNVFFVTTGVQLYLLVMITIEPMFYRDYYHMLFVILILLAEYGIGLEKNNDLFEQYGAGSS